MGNSTATSSSSTSINSSSNASLSQTPLHLSVFWSLISTDFHSFLAVMSDCHVHTGNIGWFGAKIFILLTALPANAGLMWILLRGKKLLTSSEVLGLNVSVIDVLSGVLLPLDIYMMRHESSQTVRSVSEAFFALNIFGCPLLLTSMCVERYVAAARPVAYMRLGRREYRVALCACVWTLTAVVALCGYFVHLFTMVLYLAATISVLFLIMLLCLLGIVWVLRRSGPAGASGANVPQKRRALKNILAVMVPSVVAYSPLVALVPYMIVIVSQRAEQPRPEQCCVLQVLLGFPNVGMYIGPLFYLSRFKQAAWGGNEPSPTTKTQAE